MLQNCKYMRTNPYKEEGMEENLVIRTKPNFQELDQFYSVFISVIYYSDLDLKHMSSSKELGSFALHQSAKLLLNLES